jgi:prolyl-tRNA editing enzyme YbaK/EbsC (Cys-tRNA(Pro) deacylase)
MSDEALPNEGARRVQAALAAAGSDARVIVLPQTAATAVQAADALGVTVGQIVKSLVFRDGPEGQGRLVLVSGANRVHEGRLGRALGVRLARADAEFARAATGFAIGGVAPLGLATPLPMVMDADLFAFPVVWAAAGHPSAVFPIAPALLAEITGARQMIVT